jgi:phosphonopyruvate decarboxylase
LAQNRSEAIALKAQITRGAGFVLDRAEAVPALIGRHEDFLIIAGLGGTASDVAAITGDAASVYSLGGAMGAACMMGLGLALARPKERVLVVTGDGELLMNVGALATIAVLDPANLAILCVDNGHYGETGWQKSHTSLGTDLEKIAIGCGIRQTRTVSSNAELAEGARLLRAGNGTRFIVLRVAAGEPPPGKRNFDGSLMRDRFRAALARAQ